MVGGEQSVRTQEVARDWKDRGKAKVRRFCDIEVENGENLRIQRDLGRKPRKKSWGR